MASAAGTLARMKLAAALLEYDNDLPTAATLGSGVNTGTFRRVAKKANESVLFKSLVTSPEGHTNHATDPIDINRQSHTQPKQNQSRQSFIELDLPDPSINLGAGWDTMPEPSRTLSFATSSAAYTSSSSSSTGSNSINKQLPPTLTSAAHTPTIFPPHKHARAKSVTLETVESTPELDTNEKDSIASIHLKNEVDSDKPSTSQVLSQKENQPSHTANPESALTDPNPPAKKTRFPSHLLPPSNVSPEKPSRPDRNSILKITPQLPPKLVSSRSLTSLTNERVERPNSMVFQASGNLHKRQGSGNVHSAFRDSKFDLLANGRETIYEIESESNMSMSQTPQAIPFRNSVSSIQIPKIVQQDSRSYARPQDLEEMKERLEILLREEAQQAAEDSLAAYDGKTTKRSKNLERRRLVAELQNELAHNASSGSSPTVPLSSGSASLKSPEILTSQSRASTSRRASTLGVGGWFADSDEDGDSKDTKRLSGSSKPDSGSAPSRPTSILKATHQSNVSQRSSANTPRSAISSVQISEANSEDEIPLAKLKIKSKLQNSLEKEVEKAFQSTKSTNAPEKQNDIEDDDDLPLASVKNRNRTSMINNQSNLPNMGHMSTMGMPGSQLAYPMPGQPTQMPYGMNMGVCPFGSPNPYGMPPMMPMAGMYIPGMGMPGMGMPGMGMPGMGLPGMGMPGMGMPGMGIPGMGMGMGIFPGPGGSMPAQKQDSVDKWRRQVSNEEEQGPLKK